MRKKLEVSCIIVFIIVIITFFNYHDGLILFRANISK